MTSTLLLDLDDTLLDNDISEFIPAYLEAFANHFSDRVNPEKFIFHMLAATREMLANLLPNRTLKDVFDAHFYPQIGIKPEDMQDEIDYFYSNVFPTLKRLTKPRPEVALVLGEAQHLGYVLAVATNPLFPQEAVQQRLGWAGLPTEQRFFRLISSYETFHFSKSTPAYYAEILGRMGWPDDSVVMVGNDLQDDILTAQQLGLATFWLNGSEINPENLPITAKGKLKDLIPWLKATPPEKLKLEYKKSEALLAIMRSTLAVLDYLQRNLPAEMYDINPQPGEWNITEIYCHFRDVDVEVNLPRLMKVLQETNPFLPGSVTDPWAVQRKYRLQNGPEALHNFTKARMQLIDLLNDLQPEEWLRPARHAIFGPTQLKEIVTIMANHDRLHIQQIHKVLEIINPSFTL